MPKPRAQQVSLEATAYYHCISRCVRRAFLCGDDRLTGQSFDHRKPWLVERLQELTAIFAIDICSYGLMSNHFHVVLHVDRARALGWTDAQVAERYARLFRHTVLRAQPLPETAWQRTVACWRARLWDLSWFMRCLNEAIARRANREDRCTGRFWEGRFRSQALLDAGALLTCMSYVDLNPIRAGIATSLEDSQFTSIRGKYSVNPLTTGSTLWHK
jgi:REP element-mobilizing transposase RayT